MLIANITYPGCKNMTNSSDKPELETLDYKPASSEVKQENSPIIETETRVENSEDAGQQPNQNLMLVEEIKGLLSQVNDKLGKLNENTKFLSCHRNSLVLQALEEIDLHQRTTIHDLRKAFE